MTRFEDILGAGVEYRYACTTYGGEDGPSLEESPAEFWRRIELIYPNGHVLALVYDSDPGTAEMQALMLKLQRQSAAGHFKLRVIQADGNVVDIDGFKP